MIQNPEFDIIQVGKAGKQCGDRQADPETDKRCSTPIHMTETIPPWPVVEFPRIRLTEGKEGEKRKNSNLTGWKIISTTEPFCERLKAFQLVPVARSQTGSHGLPFYFSFPYFLSFSFISISIICLLSRWMRGCVFWGDDGVFCLGFGKSCGLAWMHREVMRGAVLLVAFFCS